MRHRMRLRSLASKPALPGRLALTGLTRLAES